MRDYKATSYVTVVVFFIQVVLACVGFGTSLEALQGRRFSLPWHAIVKKVIEKSWFSSNAGFVSDSNLPQNRNNLVAADIEANYAYQVNQPLVFTLPAGTENVSLKKIQVNVAKWVQNSWQEIGRFNAGIESDRIELSSGINSEGFFCLRFIQDNNEQPCRFEAFAIVSNNWKNDILSFCLNLKENIERNPDSQLVHSSIAVSHCDHIMELISKTSVLSNKVLRALGKTLQANKDFESGKCPDLVIGLNKVRLKRFEGAKISEFIVFIPEEYDNSRKWPLFLHPDPRRANAASNYSKSSGFVDLVWHFPSPKGYEWKDYKYFLNILKEKLNLDGDRVYIDGNCNNGVAAMALALNYPDQWAECSAEMGNSYRHLAGNALNLPVIFVKGEWHSNQVEFAGYYNFAMKYFQYSGCKYFKCSETRTITELRGSPVPQATREKSPKRVLYTIESLHNPKAYWVKVIGREDENLTGKIDASVDGQTILVNTNNIDAFSLNLVQSPVDSNRPVEIIENGQRLGSATGLVFTKKPQAYESVLYVKNECISGPVSDVFTEPFVVVYGTGGIDREFAKASKEVAKSLANNGPCFADTNMPQKLVNSHNLILVGTAESNLWLSKICKNLPVQIKAGHLTANGKPYDGNDMGFILIYPNPLNPEKYTAVFSGTSSAAMTKISNAYAQMESTPSADVGIFEVTAKDDIRWYVMEKFDVLWGWHKKWDQVLAVANRKHPEWQWRQLAAKIIKEQLKADVAICEEPFKFPDSLPGRQITYRDLFNCFKNDWIVKISLDGRSLRKLLLEPFGNDSRRAVVSPIVYGVSFSKMGQDAGGTTLAAQKLENDKNYTIAAYYKTINGQRMGMVLKDYKILGEGYLVPLLKDYLCEKKNLDIDVELDCLELNTF